MKRTKANLGGGFFGRLFTSYGALCSLFRKSVVYGVFSRVRGSRAISRVRVFAARSLEGSVIVRAGKRFMSFLPWMTVRSYGAFFFSFGFYASVIFGIKAVAASLTADYDALVSGVTLMLCSVPLLLSGKTLAGAVASSRLLSYVVFDVLGFRREEAEAKRTPSGRADMAFLAGMIAGLLTFYVEPMRVLGAIVSLLLLFTVLHKPETGVILLFALFPFFGDNSLLLLISVITVSYGAKLLCGRRTLSLDMADTFVLIFFVLTAAAEVFNYGAGTGMRGSAVTLLYIVPYFLTVNLMVNQAWRQRLMRAMMFGGSAMAVVSISALFADTVAELAGGVSSGIVREGVRLFGDAAASAAASAFYLAMMMPVMIGYVLCRGSGGKRLNMVFFTAVTLAAAALSMSRGLWIGAAVGVFVMLSMIDLRLAAIPAVIAVAVPPAAALLPESAKSFLAEALNVTGTAVRDRVEIRRLSGQIFLDNLFGGIGRGDGVFEAVYDAYSSVGATSDNSQSLFLQIGIELGIVGLFVFLAATVFLLMKSFTGAKYGADKAQNLCSASLASGLIAALVAGISNDIWIDGRMFLLFFMFAGAVSAYSTGAVAGAGRGAMRGAAGGDSRSASIDIEF